MRTMLTVIALMLSLSVPTSFAATVDPVAKTVQLINSYRAKHGVRPLTLDSTISRTAQDWADQLHRTAAFEHRPNNAYSENLFWMGGRTRKIDEVIQKALESWYGESRGYQYSKEMTPSTINYGVLHFTAMVWKSSDRVGVGLKQGANGNYVVVNFALRGNVLNQFVLNVPPPVTAARQSP
ncbi:CAP family protein [Lentzea sp. NPDC060358]|uniref:CAP family protein n=1 Tax=Lentzea sp. NPDC060358 TaxID=3347103 RepID=UPI00364D3BD6